MRDSGGVYPWGEGIFVQCDCFECEDCIGMKEHGCYCEAMGAVGPGGPLKEKSSS